MIISRSPTNILLNDEELFYDIKCGFYGENNEKESFLEVEIAYPLKYPITAFRKIFFKKEDDRKRLIGKIYIIIKNDIIEHIENRVILDTFDIYPNSPDLIEYASKEEKQACKGLGKKLFLFAFNFLRDNKIVNDDTIVYLEAGGGIQNNKEIDPLEIERYRKLYPNAFDVDCTDHNDPEQLRKTASKIISNLRLIRYYQETYGMIMINNEGLHADMEGTVKKVLGV